MKTVSTIPSHTIKLHSSYPQLQSQNFLAHCKVTSALINESWDLFPALMPQSVALKNKWKSSFAICASIRPRKLILLTFLHVIHIQKKSSRKMMIPDSFQCKLLPRGRKILNYKLKENIRRVNWYQFTLHLVLFHSRKTLSRAILIKLRGNRAQFIMLLNYANADLIVPRWSLFFHFHL